MSQCSEHDACLKDALARAEAICAERGLRLTPLRLRVLSLIWETHVPIKAYDLIEKLSAELGKSIKPPTVYRTLDFLIEHGFIHRLDRLNAFIGCEHAGVHQDCYFLLCRECGHTEEHCSPALREQVLAATQTRSFTAEQTTLEISGLCASCSESI